MPRLLGVEAHDIATQVAREEEVVFRGAHRSGPRMQTGRSLA